MTPDDFKAWRSQMGMTQQEAAEALGVSKGTVINYETGTRREDGRQVEIPANIQRVMSLFLTHASIDKQVKTLEDQLRLFEAGTMSVWDLEPRRDVTAEAAARIKETVETLRKVIDGLEGPSRSSPKFQEWLAKQQAHRRLPKE